MTDKKKATPKSSPKTSRNKYSKAAYVGGGFSVRFRKRKGNSVQAQWSPRVPSAHELNHLVSTFEYKLALMAFVVQEVKP